MPEGYAPSLKKVRMVGKDVGLELSLEKWATNSVGKS